MDERTRARLPWKARAFVALHLLLALVLGNAKGGFGCFAADTVATNAPLQTLPLKTTVPSPTGSLFEKRDAASAGIDFAHRWNESVRYERLFNSSMVGGGVAIGDYDRDGRPDLCLTRPAGGCRLYRNLGDFRFTNTTARAGLNTDGAWTTGVSFADVNGDGHLDLHVCCYDGPNQVYVNRGDGTFAERASALGLAYNGASVMVAYADYDRDGDLDCYLLTAGLIPGPAQKFRVKFVNGRPVVPEELQEYWQMFYLPGERAAAAEAGQYDHLYRNNGDGSFSEVTREAGIPGCDFGNAVIWWDPDSDGWPDLYVANDYFGPDRFYRNNRDGTFRDVTREALPYTPWTSMGADSADINNDGLPDLFASDMAGTTHFKRIVDMGDSERSGWFLDLAEPRQYMRNALFLNTGTPRFLEAAHLAGMAQTDWTWSVLLEDLDGDGWVDLFVPNGMTRDWMDNDLAAQAQKLPPVQFVPFWRAQPVRRDLNLAFRNRDGLEFQNVANAWGLAHPGPSFGAAAADLDGDGRPDLIVNDFDAAPRLYRNAAPSGHRVTVQLVGRPPNTRGLGATVKLATAKNRQIRYVTLSRGFMSSGDAVAHFGLGDAVEIESLTVEWPSGETETLAKLAADRRYVVRQPGAAPAQTPIALAPPPEPALFVRSDPLAGYVHREEAFDDFARERLLPFRVSPLGPGLAWADMDRDGDLDLYVCGSAVQPGALSSQIAPGSFRRVEDSGLATGRNEMSALFFEANGDGLPDLLVVTGGGSHEAGDPNLRDHLYLNAGGGRFQPAPDGSLPDLRDSGSMAVAADWDRDGDLDLFLGSRVVPGRYGESPSSRLLRNEAGRFTDVTARLAPELEHAGMVTGALASDADGDGWIDLLLTCDWGPVRLFRNTGGRLVEHTQQAGLASLLGWWASIEGSDLAQDGAIDYIVTNLGRNSRYQPSATEPVRLYRVDLDGNGETELLEAQVTAEGVILLRGRSALLAAAPALAARFPTHRALASARLPEIIGTNAMERALRLEVSTAESGILHNDGHGKFRFQPLPPLAQIAPASAALVIDADGDVFEDLFLAQNSHAPQRETGRLAGGVGLLLRGGGGGRFDPVWPNQSGLSLPGETRAATRVDLNGDGWDDLLASTREGPLLGFVNRGGTATLRKLRIQLAGPPGNPEAIGARVTVTAGEHTGRTIEVRSGGGGLAQSARGISVWIGDNSMPADVQIRWPDGLETRARASAGVDPVQIVHPKAQTARGKP